MAVLSYLSSFGGRGTLPFGWDMLAVIVFSATGMKAPGFARAAPAPTIAIAGDEATLPICATVFAVFSGSGGLRSKRVAPKAVWPLSPLGAVPDHEGNHPHDRKGDQIPVAAPVRIVEPPDADGQKRQKEGSNNNCDRIVVKEADCQQDCTRGRAAEVTG